MKLRNLSLSLLLLSTSGCAGGPATRESYSKAQASPIAAATFAPAQEPAPDTQQYSHPPDNGFNSPERKPLSTFSIDVDTASYSNLRRFLQDGVMPPKDAVRIEEMVNYFPYSYPDPPKNQPFSINSELSNCPWNHDHLLAKIGIQARKIPNAQLPARNLVFLIDVSGSMAPDDRLPLLKASLGKLVDGLNERDRLAIVTYAGESKVALLPTAGNQKARIHEVLDSLSAGGGTNGGEGVERAYQLAQQSFTEGGVNRVILATDGDFNIGLSGDQLIHLIEEKRKTGIFLTTLGVGRDNLKDTTMEALSDRGNGSYAYLDSVAEAEKVLVREASSTTVTVAKDVKIQVEFNPKTVAEYRLIGYENRLLNARDFNDDSKDAGEIGAGHGVTALYEVVPSGTAPQPGVDPLRYQKIVADGEMAHIKIRYKPVDSEKSKLLAATITQDQAVALQETTDDFRFAAAVAQFGMVLRGAPSSQLSEVWALASSARGQDVEGYRSQFLQLVSATQKLQPQ